MRQVDLGQEVVRVWVTKREFYFFVFPMMILTTFGLNEFAVFLFKFKDSEWKGQVWWSFLILLLPFIILHELLHVLGLLYWGRVPVKSIRFGCEWKLLAPYCGSSTPIEVGAFRVTLLLPLIGLGSVGIIGFFAYPSTLMTMLVGLAIWSCSVDIWTFYKIRRFDKHLLLKGDPSVELGYLIFAPPEEKTIAQDQEKTYNFVPESPDKSGEKET